MNDGVNAGVASGINGTQWSVRGTETSVPEPATLALFGIGLVGASLAKRKKQVGKQASRQPGI